MANKLRLDDYCLRCTGCKKDYDVSKVSLEAKKKRKRNIYCPHCGHRVGTLN